MNFGHWINKKMNVRFSVKKRICTRQSLMEES